MSQTHDSSLHQDLFNSQILTLFYEFKVRIMASDKVKCKHDADVKNSNGKLQIC